MNAYSILGIEPTASAQDIKDAWRRKARACHPDCRGNNGEDMALINAAYDALKDPGRRAQHDAGLHPEHPFFGGSSETIMRAFDDLFSDIFGPIRRQDPQKGADRHHTITLPFDAPLTPLDWPLSGLVPQHNGSVRIPAGVGDGDRLRVRGKGATGPAGDGDLIITITCAPHAVYTRAQQIVIHPHLVVPMTTAALGGTITVTGIDNAPLVLRVPKGTQTGDTLVLDGAGFPPLGGGPRGPMHAICWVRTPTDLTKADERALRAMAKRAEA